MRKRFLTFGIAALCLFILLSSAMIAKAQSDAGNYTFDITEGCISISTGSNPGTIKVSYGNGQIKDNIPAAQEIIINDSSPNTSTANYIAVNSGVKDKVHIILDNVNIKNAVTSPFSINTGVTVDLTLTGTNVLMGGKANQMTSVPGLSVPPNTTLEVSAASTGDLTAQGGVVSSNGAAGIGGYGKDFVGGDCGTVIINGGTITAIGSTAPEAYPFGGGAGIGGGGSLHDRAGNGGTVIINGGTVNATSYCGGAGIGGGNSKNFFGGNCGTVILNGGTVTATSSYGGAGIGGGDGGWGGDGGAVIISGGRITATGGGGGAGIGGGYGPGAGGSGTVTISGGRVEARGGGGGAGIGGAAGGANSANPVGTVTISGGTVLAYGSTPTSDGRYGYGCGIGYGRLGVNYSGCPGPDSNVIITGGSVYATSINGVVKGSDGTRKYYVPISGLPADTKVSFTDNGGAPDTCVTDSDGKIHLWMVPGSHVVGITFGIYQYSASGNISPESRLINLRNDTGLSMVCNQVINTAGGIGTIEAPYLASILVPEVQTTISTADLTTYNIHDIHATPSLHLDSTFTAQTNIVDLILDDVTTVYICVTSQEGCKSFYRLNVTRMSANADLSMVCNQPAKITDGAGTSIDPYRSSVSVLCEKSPITIADLKPDNVYATVTLYTDCSFTSTVESVPYVPPDAETTIYIRIKSRDGSASHYFAVKVVWLDASLFMVCNQTFTTTGGSGTKNNPYLTAINVPNSMTTVATTNVKPANDAATALLFTDGTFNSTTDSVSLAVDTATTVYIRCTAQDGITCLYYAADITRVSNDDTIYTFDLSKGSITVQPGTSPGTSQVRYGASKILDKIAPSQHIMINSTSITSNTITINTGAFTGGSFEVYLSLNDVNISSSTCPFSISWASTVHLTLNGTNTLSCSGMFDAGLCVPPGAVLDITSASTGSLAAAGGSYGAGIGGSGRSTDGGYGGDCGTIIINGGTVTARNDAYGAGIGGGGSSNGGDCGTIIINGGTVTVRNDGYGAGIGGGGAYLGGHGGNGGMMLVTGGTVTAAGNGSGSGIGGGGGSYGGDGGTLTVSGGLVTVTMNGSMGSGIGGGGSISYKGGNGGTVTVSGGTVIATGSNCGSGIGGGGVGIWGNGIGGDGGAMTVSGGTVIATGGASSLLGGLAGDGIGRGGGAKYSSTCGTVTVNGGSVNASSMVATVNNGSGAQEYLVTVTGLPVTAAVSYAVDGGNTVSCSTDTGGKLYLWLPQTGIAIDILIACADSVIYHATGCVQASNNNIFQSVLPSDQEGCLVTYKGAQKRFNDSTQTYDIRFIATIDTLSAKEVGFVFSKSQPIPTRENATVNATTTVYTSIAAVGSTVTAESLGGTYIIVCTVTGIPASDIDVPLYVRAFSTVGSVTKYTPVVTITVKSLP